MECDPNTRELVGDAPRRLRPKRSRQWRSRPRLTCLGGTLRARPRIQQPFRTSSTVEQAAVNRKVQGSNPWSGAKSELESGSHPRSVPLIDSNLTATAFDDETKCGRPELWAA